MKQLGVVADWRLDDYTPESIADKTRELIEKARGYYDAVGAVDSDQVDFENVVKRLLDVECIMMNEESPLDAIQHASTKKELREASVASSKKLNSFGIEMMMRKDVFDNVRSFRDSEGYERLNLEHKRFVDKLVVEGKRNGLHLPEEERNAIKEIKRKMSDLATEFSSNLNEDVTALYFKEEELEGVPEDLVSSFERDSEGRCKVTLKYPHFFPVTRKCRVPETRKRVETAYLSRCLSENTKILEELVALRQKEAESLGYENHAHYVLEPRMARNPAVVKTFLEGLASDMQPIWEKEREELLQLKKEECAKYGYEFNGKLDFWDVRYYVNLVEETRYSVDKEALKQYFPLEKVTSGLLEIYQQLLGLTFTECAGDVDVWHPEVKLYKVQNAETNRTYGYFYLDLHPRDGKYGHAAVFPVQPGCVGPDGNRQVSVCIMMANFSKPGKGKPALLGHDEVETYFHEFGHVMHNVCSQPEVPRFGGCRVERDFVEAPSQMLENWVWEEEPLRKMSGHYEDGSPVPKNLLEKLMASRKANTGAFTLRQIVLGTFDQRIHTVGEADTRKVFADTYKEILGIDTIEGTNMSASFGHMCGYDAQYYGYLWSEVYSFDMFETRFKKEGLSNTEVGVDYRDTILKPGGSVDAIDMLKTFLGRPPNNEAFLRSRGLSAT